MRAVKLAGIIVGAFIAVVVLAAIAIVIFVNPNDYRSDIERLAKQRTGRDLAIRGTMDLKLFPWIALEIHDVTLGNPRGYSATEPFASIKSANIGVKLLPLLRSRVEVRKVSLDGLQANLVSRSATDNNWKDFGQKEPAESAAPAGRLSATVQGVEISHSGLSYRDEEKHTLSRITNLEAHLGAIGSDSPVDTRAALDYETEKGPVGHIEINGSLKVPASGPIEARNLKLQVLLRKEGRAVPVAVNVPSMVVDIRGQTLSETRIDASYDGIPLQATAAGTKLFGERDVHGTLTLPDTRAVPKPLGHVSASARYALGKNDVRLSAIDAHLDDSHITGTAGIDDLEKLAMRFDLTVDRIDLDRYLPPAEVSSGAAGAKAGAGAGANAMRAAPKKSPPVKLPLETLRTLFAQGTLKVGQARVHGLALTDLSLPVAASGGLLRLAPTSARLYGGGYNGSLQLDARPATATLALDQHLHNVDLGAVALALFKTSRIIGHGDADAKLNSSGNTDDALIAGLSGKVQMNVRDGAYSGIDLWYEIRAARALLSGQIPPARAGPARTAFRTLAASAVLDHGVARNDDLKVDADYLKVTGKGTVNFVTKAVDYKLTTQLTQIPPAGAGDDMRDLKSVQIPVSLSGTLDDMKVRPDLQGILKSRLQDEVKKRLGDKLKGLFNR